MRFKKHGTALTLEIAGFFIIVFAVFAGMRAFNANSVSGYQASIMMQQAESIDRALLKYGQMHRGFDKKSAKIDPNKEERGLIAKKPPLYPATQKDLENLRDYSIGYVSPTIVISNDDPRSNVINHKPAGKKAGIYYYVPYGIDGNTLGDSAPGVGEGAYSFDLYVDLPNGRRYYTQNSKNRDKRGSAGR